MVPRRVEQQVTERPFRVGDSWLYIRSIVINCMQYEETLPSTFGSGTASLELELMLEKAATCSLEAPNER